MTFKIGDKVRVNTVYGSELRETDGTCEAIHGLEGVVAEEVELSAYVLVKLKTPADGLVYYLLKQEELDKL